MPEASFYYSADGERVPLRPSSDTLVIAYREEVPPKDLEKLIRGDDRLAKFTTSAELERRNLVVYKRNPAATASMEAFAARLARSDMIDYTQPLYYRGRSPVIVSDEFIAAFKAGVSQQAIESLNTDHGVVVVQEFDFAPRTFLLRVLPDQEGGALQVANRYYETGLVEYAEPNFIYIKAFKFPHTPNDPLFADQWHLPRIQASNAWDISRGDSALIVAVIDDGVDLDHEDIARRDGGSRRGDRQWRQQHGRHRDRPRVPPPGNPPYGCHDRGARGASLARGGRRRRGHHQQ
jgi:hypothetical protein